MVDFKLEAIVIPVSDVDRAKAFYAEQCGFVCDVDHPPSESFRSSSSRRLAPRARSPSGSGCRRRRPAATRACTCRSDIEAGRAELAARGLDISEPFHFGPEGKTTGSTHHAATSGRTARSATPTAMAGCCRRSRAAHLEADRLRSFFFLLPLALCLFTVRAARSLPRRSRRRAPRTTP